MAGRADGRRSSSGASRQRACAPTPGAGWGGRVRLGASLGPLGALVIANLRYWPTVAPATARELSRWQAPAEAIGDRGLRALALEKLHREHFNAQVAATLATLAPRRARTETVQAIVALELLFDYLDGRTEQLGDRVLEQSAALFAPLVDAVAIGAESALGAEAQAGGAHADWGYLLALSARTRTRFRALPGAVTVAPLAAAALERCAQAQTRIHAVEALGVGQLREWARHDARDSGLGWREYAAGCASSVLACHALIAAAADPTIAASDARRLDEAYLATGAAITILDSLADEAQDRAEGLRGFTSLYEPGELGEVLPGLVREALARSLQAPEGNHHAMTLAGVVAYYTSHPGASAGPAHEIAGLVRAEVSPTVWPALAVMRSWRLAKRVRALTRTQGNARGQATAHIPGRRA